MPNSKQNDRGNLIALLEGEILPDDFLKMYRDRIDADFAEASIYRIITRIDIDSSIKIPVAYQHLVNMLRKYFRNEVSDVQLSHWAYFIIVGDWFVPEGNTLDEQWESGDGLLWTYLNQLMTPQFCDGTVFENTNKMIEKLKKSYE